MTPMPVAETQPVVLVVEDEALLRLCAADLLEDAGFEVIQAPDARAALDVMKSRPDVRLLFTDIQMPGKLDGMELAQKVHEQWPRVLLLVTSGALRPKNTEIADHGHFLAKPYTEKRLLEEIDNLGREADERRGTPSG
jgi:two-component system, response regulator PdtaR